MIKVKRKQREGFGSFGTIELSHLEGTIMSSFFPEGKEMTIKEIMERTDYSYERVNSALKSLTEKKIVMERKVGKTLVYYPDLTDLYIESMGFNAYMLGREIDFIKKHRIIYNAVKEIMNNPSISILILFGSYSKDTETKQSDIDIICVSDKKEETKEIIYSLKHKYGFNFSPVVLSTYEFPDIKKDNPELWDDLKMHGIVFKGDDSFYYWVYKNDKGR